MGYHTGTGYRYYLLDNIFCFIRNNKVQVGSGSGIKMASWIRYRQQELRLCGAGSERDIYGSPTLLPYFIWLRPLITQPRSISQNYISADPDPQYLRTTTLLLYLPLITQTLMRGRVTVGGLARTGSPISSPLSSSSRRYSICRTDGGVFSRVSDPDAHGPLSFWKLDPNQR